MPFVYSATFNLRLTLGSGLNSMHSVLFFILFVICCFFSKSSFYKKIFQDTSECLTVWIQIRPDIFSALILVKTVKVLIDFWLNVKVATLLFISWCGSAISSARFYL